MSGVFEGNPVPVFVWEAALADSAGVSVSLLRFTISFFVSIAVAVLFRYVPTVRGRHLFSLLSGLLLVLYPFGNGCLHLMVPSLATYAAMVGFRQHCGTLSWLVTFPYLIICHALNASGQTWKEGVIDFTGAQMVVTLKIIAIAVNYQNGLKQQQDLRSYPADKRLEQIPSLLEYYSYLLSIGNLLAGPFFEFKDFQDYCTRQGTWREPLPAPWAAGGIRLLKGVTFMLLYLQLTALLPPQLLESGWYFAQPLAFKVVLLGAVGLVNRFKYYFAWAIAESGLILCGLCFNGYEDGRPKWNRYINARIRYIEGCTSAAQFAGQWNVCTGNWLRHYVYDRLTKRGSKPTFTTLLATQLVSSVWHGLYPGYILFFFSIALFFEASRVIYRYEQAAPVWVARFPLWVAVKWVYTTLFTLNYLASAFMVLTFWESIEIWRSMYFLGHILMLAIILGSRVFPPPRKPKAAASKEQ